MLAEGGANEFYTLMKHEGSWWSCKQGLASPVSTQPGDGTWLLLMGWHCSNASLTAIHCHVQVAAPQAGPQHKHACWCSGKTRLTNQVLSSAHCQPSCTPTVDDVQLWSWVCRWPCTFKAHARRLATIQPARPGQARHPPCVGWLQLGYQFIPSPSGGQRPERATFISGSLGTSRVWQELITVAFAARKRRRCSPNAIAGHRNW